MTIQGLPLPPLMLDIRRAATLADDMFTRFVLALHPIAPRRATPESTFRRDGQFDTQRAADRVGVHTQQDETLPAREALHAMFAVSTAPRPDSEEEQSNRLQEENQGV